MSAAPSVRTPAPPRVCSEHWTLKAFSAPQKFAGAFWRRSGLTFDVEADN